MVTSIFSCGIHPGCNGATSYCLNGSVPNACLPLPPECTACEEVHTCECLLAHLSPCDGGSATCTPYVGGAQLWYDESGCH